MSPLIYKTEIQKFGEQGEKTGWTYVLIPAEEIQKIYTKDKKSFMIKGHIDAVAIEQISLIPMGGGDYILPLNNDLRKKLKKKKCDSVSLNILVDQSEFKHDKDMMEALNMEHLALAHFNTFPGSHKKYYSKWIQSAKTEATKAKRIAIMINSLIQKMNYGEMIRSQKNQK
ncbi:MAG: YdeI/OmpD-associated family protein [Chitinophagaceae bacterium]